jgi:hypothetical protein
LEVKAACFAVSFVREFLWASKFTPFGDLTHGLCLFLQVVLGSPVFVEIIPHGPSLGPSCWFNPILSRFSWRCGPHPMLILNQCIWYLLCPLSV